MNEQQVVKLLQDPENFVRQIATEVVRTQSAEVIGAVKISRAAELLDMTEWRVRQLIRDGRLKVIHPTPKTMRVPVAEIRRFTEGES